MKPVLSKKSAIAFLALAGLVALIYASSTRVKVFVYENFLHRGEVLGASTPAIVTSPWHYYFTVDGTLSESSPMDNSSSPYFWLSSGAYLFLSNGTAKTVHGELDTWSKWRVAYANSNPRDTDNGYHPQNIFRLVTRSKWLNHTSQVSFKIDKTILSDSPERNAWSGILFFSRYQDSNNLYYAGIRMDGHAVIKKKLSGVYYTLAEKAVFPGVYDRTSNPTLLPQQKWMKIKLETSNTSTGTRLRLFLDRENNNTWETLLDVTDTRGKKDGDPISQEGYSGIRTDFQEVEFDDFICSNI